MEEVGGGGGGGGWGSVLSDREDGVDGRQSALRRVTSPAQSVGRYVCVPVCGKAGLTGVCEPRGSGFSHGGVKVLPFLGRIWRALGEELPWPTARSQVVLLSKQRH